MRIHHPPSVLVVGDAVSATISVLLREDGYVVSHVPDVDNIATSEELVPDLVLVDVPHTRDKMAALVKTVKERFQSAHLIGLYPWNHLYGYSPEAYTLLRSMGFEQIVPSPVEPDTFLALLRRILTNGTVNS